MTKEKSRKTVSYGKAVRRIFVSPLLNRHVHAQGAGSAGVFFVDHLLPKQFFLNFPGQTPNMANENISAINPFVAIMAKKTDAELAKILSVDKNQFTQEALNAAKEEYAKRDLKEDLLAKTIEDQEVQKEKIEITAEMEVSKGLRLLHFIVDMLIIYGIAIVSFIVAAYFNIEFESNAFLDQILFAIFMVCYYLGFESQLYTTPAKMLTQCTVVMENGDKPGYDVIAKRSICRLIPFEVFSFLGAGSGWHDVLSKTKVIRIK